ncbi:zinc ion-binding protein [Rhynchospora pubera]|uniref:Zinc ion-binding protein n=1 Tax=Rhynchospora pubera TaxID=906938 RepID=A0AAV8CLS4_9POAL|nr:zinc ion-binding protein [Rhynchospora pubera]
MKKTGRICGLCGDIGLIEKSAVCSVCNIACGQTCCAQALAPDQVVIWYCQTCRKQQTKMAEKKNLDEGTTKQFGNSKVKFLSPEEVRSMSSGAIRRCIKTTTTSVVSSVRSAPPRGAPNQTQTSIAKSASDRLLSAKKMLFGEPGSSPHSVVGSKETSNELGSLKGQLPYRPAPIAWKGSLEVSHLVGKPLVELVAYFPLQVSAKLYNAIATLPSKLQMKIVPHSNAWPKQLGTDLPNLEDIGIYLLPSGRRSSLKCLLRQVDSNNCALKMNVNSRLQLVVYSSRVLAENAQRIEGDFFFWGFFLKRKMSSCSKKKEIIEDMSNICENKSSENEIIADTFGVSPGFAKPFIGQETNPMDRQSVTSMQGKETQLVDKGVAPGCSLTFDLTDKGSGCRRFFSSIGVSLLETALETCENQEEYPNAPVLTDTTSEKTEEVAESKRAPKQLDASLEAVPDQGGREQGPDIVPQQLDTPGFGSSSRILIKQEKEPLIPLPVSLEITPGFLRNVERGEEKSISNQQLDTLPGFGTSGRVLIKQEMEPLIPLPVGLEIPPGFSKKVEARIEKNISNEFSSRSLPMNQVLNDSSFVPDNFSHGPLLRNQGIVHQGTPVGQRTVFFSNPVLQGTPSESRSSQPTSLGGINDNTLVLLSQGTSQQRAIPEVSPNHSETVQEDADLTEVDPEMCHKRTPKNSENNQDVSPVWMMAQSQNANQTRVPPHFRVLNPQGPIAGYCPPSNKETAVSADMPKREGSHQSEIWSRTRSPGLRKQSQSKSPVLRWKRNSSRSPLLKRKISRSRSPVLRRKRSRSRSPVRRRERSRSRSPVRRRERSRSRSPIRRRERSRSRSPVRRQHRRRSRSPVQRQYSSPICRQHNDQGRSLVDSKRYSSECKSGYKSRSRLDFGSSHSPIRRCSRDRSRSLSLPP